MTDYRIKELGCCFVIAADGQDVLRCTDENIARQIVSDAKADRWRRTRFRSGTVIGGQAAPGAGTEIRA